MAPFDVLIIFWSAIVILSFHRFIWLPHGD